MKKYLSFLLIFAMIFSMFSCVTVYAENDDVNINAGDFWGAEDPFAPKFTVSVEDGKDAGYLEEVVKGENYSYTAVAYTGNEFVGWYNGDEVYSTDATITLAFDQDIALVAKFIDNNVLTSPKGGFELEPLNENYIGSSWGMVATDSWRTIKVTDKYAKSGENSLELKIQYQKDVYANLTNLEKNTYYVVSYYWMLPKSVITDTSTAKDGYLGSVVTTTNVDSIETARKEQNFGGDYVDKNISFVGGQWNKTEYVFYTGDNTDLRMFFAYDAEIGSGNDAMYIDEFTIHRPENQAAVATYKVTVSGTDCYTYASHNTAVAYDTEVWVACAPNGGYAFEGWYENDVKVSDEELYRFNITANRNLVAKCVPATEEYTPDVNDDKVVNLKDLVTLAQYVADWDVTINEAVTDVNGSGATDLNDVNVLAQYLAGWDVEEDMAKGATVLPEEDLTDVTLSQTLLAGENEYYNKSTVINQGDKTRIANVFKKAQRGEDITIVGFGGSITNGTGATSANNRYGESVAAWFRAQFPDITVTYVNAGIGSTTSLVGVNRMAEDVLEHNPDFVIVDFTTNDQPGDKVYEDSYEAVVRRLLEADAAVLSVVFGPVSSYDASNGEGKNNRDRNSMKEHLPTLLYYDIPTIDYFGALWRYIDAGVINWTQVAQDYIHPNNNGHLMAASAINAYLADVLADAENIDTTVPAIPDEYFFNDTYATANFLNVEPTENNGFTTGTVHAGSNPINGWLCTSAGSSITFTANNATAISVFLQSKEGNGTANIYINGEKVVENTDCSSSSTSGFIWIKYNKVFDEAQDITITIEANGKLGLAPIGVAYAK